MPQQKLTIVPVTLHTENKKSLRSTSSEDPLTSICNIKTANAEISFYGGVDEQAIQNIMKELNICEIRLYNVQQKSVECVLKIKRPYLLKILLGWSPCPIEKEFNNPIRAASNKNSIR
ncbi:hypothetical protein Q8G35_12710 [Peribacillus simplex]|uniref:Uncharacterized protein n=2 Tax=Peribacillus TaxID=2675229 RepID=A0AA90P1Y1_9BACI|nr:MULTISPECIES: hypothetical protein [Peribacillus]MDP1419269.1 hypothetical protein [Peribacillus simplex]MDP1452093.1 hypothetical protein [Peribacillus frigoritolerans]